MANITRRTQTMANITRRTQTIANMRTMATNKMTGKTKIELFYDIFSPYTWFAFEVLIRYKKHWNMDLELKPFLLAALSKSTGTTAPMLVPNKALYMTKDLIRCAQYFNVPLKLIEDPAELIFGKGSLIPNRFLIATSLLYPQHLESLSRALWMAVWNKDTDFTQPEVLTTAGLESGMSMQEIERALQHLTHQETKDLLRLHTQQALDYDAFGSPSIVAHVGEEPKLFFGSDRFPILAQEIGEVWMGPEPDNIKHKL
ncbi:hypothetical protein Pmani_000390 [Petrolisthes manimaculis]|uniref:Glutathione S-transferase kappa 1 n=1 Tax=Petrolisthes manimaculis TaxID=1843537 RepID=A0AAE1QM37_9EUCA|nr:hypothetical protein Pmani_000390 [Petrolisthes manimaculis]